MYLVSTMNRGCIHVSPMRVFESFDEAAKYANMLDKIYASARMWEVSDNLKRDGIMVPNKKWKNP